VGIYDEKRRVLMTFFYFNPDLGVNPELIVQLTQRRKSTVANDEVWAGGSRSYWGTTFCLYIPTSNFTEKYLYY
jgi:hypothetical protein